MGKIYGYARVSTKEQNLSRQVDALAAFGVYAEDVFCDKASGVDFERPAWKRLVEGLSAGDAVVVKSIDRLGRDYDEVLEVWREITKVVGADIVVIDMPLLDTRTETAGVMGRVISDIVLALLSYVAQDERERIRQRQAEGIAAAKARGVRFGRPRKQVPCEFASLLEDYRDGTVTRAEAASRLGVSQSTFSRWAAAAAG